MPLAAQRDDSQHTPLLVQPLGRAEGFLYLGTGAECADAVSPVAALLELLANLFEHPLHTRQAFEHVREPLMAYPLWSFELSSEVVARRTIDIVAVVLLGVRRPFELRAELSNQRAHVA